MLEYEIKKEPVIIDKQEVVKYNIYYYKDGVEYSKEFHSYDGVNGFVKYDSIAKEKK